MASLKIFILLLAVSIPFCFASDPPRSGGFLFWLRSLFAGPIQPPTCELSNYNCIASYLNGNSGCQMTPGGQIPQSFVVNEFTYDIPTFQASCTDNNLVVTNMNLCNVSLFTVNPQSGKGVLGIDCPNMGIEEDRVVRKHQSLTGDMTYNFHMKEQFPFIRFTVVFQSISPMNLCDAEISTDILGTQTYDVVPLDDDSKNFLANNPTFVTDYNKEVFYARSIPTVRYFVKNVLCDYGCTILGI